MSDDGLICGQKITRKHNMAHLTPKIHHVVGGINAAAAMATASHSYLFMGT
jgi:hypothetical protein